MKRKGFPCACGTAGEACKKALLRKASVSDAHVVRNGTRVGGLRPSNTSQGFFYSLKAPDPLQGREPFFKAKL